MPLYPARALERAMKISEVITRAISGKINWIEAAEILGMSDRQLRRWRNRWDKYGYGGLFDHRTRQPSPKRVSMAEVEKRYVLRVLQAVSGNKTLAAGILQLDRKTLYRKLQSYGIT